VYYIAFYREPDPLNPGQFRDSGSINGATYTNDCFSGMVNKDQGGIVIARMRAATGGGLTTAAIKTTLGHECGHFLLDHYVQQGWPGEHRGPACPTPPCACTGGADEFYIMHGTGCRPRWKLTTGAGSECDNIRNNLDEHPDFVDPL
jgi:hypothetical protein